MDRGFEESLKFVEIENTIDLYFYRPIGYKIACLLQHTGITPNMITVFSIFVGAGSGCMFYFDSFICAVIGILFLVFANILDCVDGQLARMTGIKSEIGRILDGIAGYVWFILIYVGLALRLAHEYHHTIWFFVVAIISGLSHLLQANITDYYKTVHLYFVSKEKGYEFQKLEEVKNRQKKVHYGLKKIFFTLYEEYTNVQEKMTPSLQHLLYTLQLMFGNDFSENIRIEFRQKSCRLMKQYIDMMTFNGRTILLFIAVLTGYVWIYFIYEAVILNVVLIISIRKHERMCEDIDKRIVLKNLGNEKDCT